MRILALALSCLTLAAAADDALVEAGRRIYEHGVLPSGEPLEGLRPGGSEVRGREGACVLCHQRSGLGMSEGAIPMPPVSGPTLFGKASLPGHEPRRAPGMQFRDYPFRTRPPYDDASLARALRDGVNPDGHAFHYLMPRYALAGRDMDALVAYLRSLSAVPSPGVEEAAIHFATVVAPGMASERRESYLRVLRACFDERYPGQPGRQAWRLHVWQLEGEPAAWERQLREHYARQPVFAMVSGLGTHEWAPVERFCESSALPCLFPNVEAPGESPGWYSFHFFRGVTLEAAVLAQHIGEQRDGRGLRRVVQLHGGEGSGARAAAALRAALGQGGLAVVDREVRDPSDAGLLRGIGRGDALVLWLAPRELAALTRRAPPPASLLLLSGMLAGLEDAPLPPAWKQAAVMAYPYDPPRRWTLRMERNLRPWLAQHGIARGDERLQGNTLAACNLLTESMLRLRGQYFRDHLVEWVESYPSAMGNAPAPQAFPRFGLGPGQRFSSKGAWLVRFEAPGAARLVPVQGEWIVP